MERREKKPKQCQGHETAVAGDIWDHTAVTADSKLVGSRVVGKRTYEHTKALGQDTKNRLRPGYLPAIFTDASAGDESARWEVFGRRSPTPHHSATRRAARAQLRWPQG